MAPESGDDSRTTIDTSRHLTTVDTVRHPADCSPRACSTADPCPPAGVGNSTWRAPHPGAHAEPSRCCGRAAIGCQPDPGRWTRAAWADPPAAQPGGGPSAGTANAARPPASSPLPRRRRPLAQPVRFVPLQGDQAHSLRGSRIPGPDQPRADLPPLPAPGVSRRRRSGSSASDCGFVERDRNARHHRGRRLSGAASAARRNRRSPQGRVQ
jgi:hypothetical protein